LGFSMSVFVIAAQVLVAVLETHWSRVYSAGSPECCDIRNMSNGHSGTVFRVRCQKN